MASIKFSKEAKDVLVKKIQAYFREELEQDLGQFDSQFLLDFFADEVGPYFYNQGLYDAQSVLTSRLESISEAIYEIEKPTSNH